MKRNYLAFVFILLSVTYTYAQSKLKSSTQSARPSKQTTINYLNDKLNEEATGIFLITEEVWSTGNEIDRTERIEATCYAFQIFEDNSLAFLSYKVKEKHFVGSRNYSSGRMDFNTTYNDGVYKIPVSKIKSLKFIQRTDTIIYKSISDKIIMNMEQGLTAITSGNNIFYQRDGNASYQQFAFFKINGEEASKIEKAIYNLKGFYKQKADPFDN